MSWLKNLQYDLEGMVAVVEAVDLSADLQAFIRSHQQQPTKIPQEVQIECQQEGQETKREQGSRQVQAQRIAPNGNVTMLGAQPFWALYTPRPQKLTPAKVQQREAVVYIQQVIESEFQPLCRGLFGCGESEGNLSTDGSAEETVHSEASRTKVPSIEQIRLEFGDQRRRVAFCQVLRGEILLREPPHTELENASPILLASAAFEVLTAMVYAALDACSEKNDIWCGRDLVVLVHLFTTKLENSKVVCLLERVYRHPLEQGEFLGKFVVDRVM